MKTFSSKSAYVVSGLFHISDAIKEGTLLGGGRIVATDINRLFYRLGKKSFDGFFQGGKAVIRLIVKNPRIPLGKIRSKANKLGDIGPISQMI